MDSGLDSGLGSDSRRVEADELRSRLLDLIRPVVEDNDAILVDLELAGSGHYTVVRVLVHRDAGVTVQTCEAVSREVGDLLDVEDPLRGRYRLEVTSPGLDRPLESDGDFQRARGRKLKVLLTSGRSLSGRLTEWDTDFIRLEDPEGDQAIARGDIVKARIEVEF